MNRKLYKCKYEGCETEQPILSKGLCNYHRMLQRAAEEPKVIRPKSKKVDSCLDAYFDIHLSKLTANPFSEESSSRIYDPSKKNVCHLLPKRNFKSVQCNLDNCVYLTWQEHSDFDRLLDQNRFEELEKNFPNSWLLVCSRIKKLLPLCSERNKLYFSLSEYLEYDPE